MSQSHSTARNDYIVVAAVDFGTTYLGYAFILKEDYSEHYMKENCRLQIHTNEWVSKLKSSTSFKAPTTVMFDQNQEFHSFGFQAEEDYADLIENENVDHTAWFCFERFKMKLHDQLRLKRDFMLEDEAGKGMEAKKVFGACIKFLKEHLIKHIEERCERKLRNGNDIYWVLTVPAIWNDTAKQFMREAANEAGIEDDDVFLALEPEAAAHYCTTLPKTSLAYAYSDIQKALKPGGKYMILDLGGGTADSVVHEVQKDGSLLEIHKASGGYWGGTVIDEKFLNYMKEQLGKEGINRVEQNCPSEWIRLMQDFELISYKGVKNVKLPIHQKILIKSNQEVKDLTRFKTNLEIDDVKTKKFFEPVCREIAHHISKIVDEIKDLRVILMVGCFSESPYVKEFMKEKFKDHHIIVPLEAGMPVLKGAVLLGCRRAFSIKRNGLVTAHLKASG